MNKSLSSPPLEVVLWGGTGQAKVVRPILERQGSRVVAVFDDTLDLRAPFADVPLLRGDQFERWMGESSRAGVGFVIAIGNPHGRIRLRLADRLVGYGLVPTSVVHSTAFVEPNAEIGEGVQLMAGAFVGAEARLGRQCIINTNASVDHEDVLGDGVEVGPGATLCGLVEIDVNGWVCAGATVLPRLRIGADAIVGAGSLVTRDVEAGAVVIGVPARNRKKE